MKKIILISFLSLIFSFSAFSPNFDFFEDIYISSEESRVIYDLQIDPYDYDSYIYIYLEDDYSFQNHQVEARVRMETQGGDTCDFEAELFAFDDDYRDLTVSDTIYPNANTGWSEWASIDIDVNALFVQLIFNFDDYYCDLNNPAFIDVEIAIDGGSQEEPPPPEPDPPNINFWADDTNINEGDCTYLNWEVFDAEYVYLDDEAQNHSDYQYVCPSRTTTYTLDVLGSDGQWYSDTVTIYVEEEAPTPEPDPPGISFWADDTNINEGDCTYLHWTVYDAINVYLDGTEKKHSIKKTICPSTTTTYTLEVYGEDGQRYSDTVTIYVEEEAPPPEPDPPDFSFWADENNLQEGECTYLIWEVFDVEDVYLDDEAQYHSDDKYVCPSTTTTYTLDVLGSDGKWYADSVTIHVDKEPTPDLKTPFEIMFWAEEYEIEKGECTTLYWEVFGSEQVYLNNISKNLTGELEVCPQETEEFVMESLGTNGQSLMESLVIEVIELKECENDDGFILIVTDSKKLNDSTGDASAWQEVKAKLEDYYGSSAQGCLGKPIFLDMVATDSGSAYSADAVDREIEILVDSLNIDSPAAVAIIGGPQVIPHASLPSRYFGSDFMTDDVFADFDHDAESIPDTVITRLPDGEDKQLILNYISALSRGNEPPDSALFVADITDSAHRLYHQMDFKWRVAEIGIRPAALYFEDYIGLQTDEITYLIAPLWSDYGYQPDNIDYSLIRPDDPDNYNIKEEIGIYNQLNHKHIIFGHFYSDESNIHYFTYNSNGNIECVYDYSLHDFIPEGAHFFSLVPNSANIGRQTQYSDISIPLLVLNEGAHHFIGATGNLRVTRDKSFWYKGESYGEMGLDYAGGFAALFFRMSSEDPAANLWYTKIRYARESLTACGEFHTLIYFGLPEKRQKSFGKNINVLVLSEPEPQDYGISPSKDCPSGILDDCDGDHIPDIEEFRLAEAFKPYLILDEGETQWPFVSNNLPPPFAVYWQVSPAKLFEKDSRCITYVFTYSEDWGVHDLDITYTDCLKCLKKPVQTSRSCAKYDAFCHGRNIGGKIVNGTNKIKDNTKCILVKGFDLLDEIGVNYNYNQWLFGHHGDNEGFRIFIHKKPDGKWELSHVNWTRHGHGFDHPGNLQTFSEADSSGLRFDNTHPILYVSEDKHGMYPSHKACESFKMEVKTDKTISFEHCSGHHYFNKNHPYKPLILKEHNVGEEGIIQVLGGADQFIKHHLLEDLSPIFPGENVWDRENDFCGSIGPSDAKLDKSCGGKFGNKWYDPHTVPTIYF